MVVTGRSKPSRLAGEGVVELLPLVLVVLLLLLGLLLLLVLAVLLLLVGVELLEVEV